MISKKVLLTGHLGVGKTSLFNRFLYQRFNERYLTTIGIKADQKILNINGQELSMLVWDVAGEVRQDKVPRTYFLGSSALIYVFDLTRPTTFREVMDDIQHLRNIVPDVIIRVVGNKLDLVAEDSTSDLFTQVPVPIDYLTSAKTGENVEALFLSICEELLANV